jgi:hypothetical protein
MNPGESWIAEQSRLLDLEEGFGPDRAPRSEAPAPEAEPEQAA